jgi:citrate synthase
MTKQPTRAATAICGYDADHIQVRGQNLVSEVMGHFSFTELMLLQALGERPTPLQVKILDAVMVTIMEHGLVPSAVVTRLTHYGAPESFQGAVVAGLLGVGDRYAGTASECGAVLERMVAAPSDQRRAAAIEELNRYRAIRRPVPGFGHPIHQALDPRVERLIDIVRSAGAAGEYIDAMYLLQDTLRETLGKPLVTNISAAMGAVMAEAGIPSGMMRGVVLTARCAGLVGHLWEEMRQPAAPAIWEAAQAAVDYQPQ